MATKRDGKGKAKVGSSQASEERYDEPNQHIFRTPINRQRFALYFQNRPIIVERPVKLDELYDLRWSAEFERRGWTNYMQLSWRAVVPIVREFYANGDTELQAKGRLLTFVRGISFDLCERDFGRVMGIQVFNGDTYPYSEGQQPSLDTVAKELREDKSATWGMVAQMGHKHLSLRYRILNLITCHNLIPKARKMIITADQAQFLYAIGKGVDINLPRLVMFEVMRNMEQKGRMSLPFAGIITELCRNRGVNVSRLEERKSMASIGRSTVDRSLKNVCETQFREEVELEEQMEVEVEEAGQQRNERTEDILGAVLQELQHMKEVSRAREYREDAARRDRKAQDEETRRVILRELEEMRAMSRAQDAKIEEMREMSRARDAKIEEFHRDILRQVQEVRIEFARVRFDVSGLRDRQEETQHELLDAGEDLRMRLDTLSLRIGSMPLPPPPPPST